MRGARALRRARLGPMREEEHQRPVRQVIDHMAQELDGGRVGPVEILDDEHERLRAALLRERQLKTWSRAKKEALIAGEIAALKRL